MSGVGPRDILRLKESSLGIVLRRSSSSSSSVGMFARFAGAFSVMRAGSKPARMAVQAPGFHPSFASSIA